MAELAMVLDNDFTKPRPPQGFTPMSPEERKSYNEWWQSLSMRGRLEAYRNGEV